ncbi:unnamed protein product [Pleuronectes platessa]|uniref:Uncharacterized protein n=1 Tax=Pleuronectes platessa TaxID=8262 RepID=A0A9N7TS73_PLEPL|nr:unnamed protein product [Pleuronectes platessa]
MEAPPYDEGFPPKSRSLKLDSKRKEGAEDEWESKPPFRKGAMKIQHSGKDGPSDQLLNEYLRSRNPMMRRRGGGRGTITEGPTPGQGPRCRLCRAAPEEVQHSIWDSVHWEAQYMYDVCPLIGRNIIDEDDDDDDDEGDDEDDYDHEDDDEGDEDDDDDEDGDGYDDDEDDEGDDDEDGDDEDDGW